MTPQQIEALKLAFEALDIAQGMLADLRSQHQPKMLSAYTALEEVLAEHAMQEVQRLGQEIEQKIGCVNHDCDQCKAQPEQEPVAYRSRLKSGSYTYCITPQFFDNAEPLYTTPPQRKPLTKEEMFDAIRPLYSSEMSARIAVDYSEDEYRAIEAAHGIKENT